MPHLSGDNISASREIFRVGLNAGAREMRTELPPDHIKELPGPN
jgi:hypothetical protein